MGTDRVLMVSTSCWCYTCKSLYMDLLEGNIANSGTRIRLTEPFRGSPSRFSQLFLPYTARNDTHHAAGVTHVFVLSMSRRGSYGSNQATSALFVVATIDGLHGSF